MMNRVPPDHVRDPRRPLRTDHTHTRVFRISGDFAGDREREASSINGTKADL